MPAGLYWDFCRALPLVYSVLHEKGLNVLTGVLRVGILVQPVAIQGMSS